MSHLATWCSRSIRLNTGNPGINGQSQGTGVVGMKDLRQALEARAKAYCSTKEWLSQGTAPFSMSQSELYEEKLSAYLACADDLLPLIEGMREAVIYYAKHPSVISEACHTDQDREVQVVHTFINHKAREALAQFDAAIEKLKGIQ